VDEFLSEEERAVRDRVRAFSDEEVIPLMTDCWERAEFPFDLVPKIGGLGICGDTIKGYGCAGLNAVATLILGKGVPSRRLSPTPMLPGPGGGARSARAVALFCVIV